MSGLPVLSDQALMELLREDAPYGDLTTSSLGFGERRGVIEFSARRDMRLSGVEEAARMLALCGADVQVRKPSGLSVEAGQCFLRGQASAESLHRVWKTAQTLMEYASGIATRASTMVDAIRRSGSEAMLACTRKNFPGTRALSIKAVCDGGAVAHRLGLSETVLVMPEHQAFLRVDATQWLGDLARRCPEKRIVVEVTSHEQGLLFARAGADVIQLEKFSVNAVRGFVVAVKHELPRVRVAAAGGIDETNAASYAATGIDVVVSSAPYSAPPADVSVRLLPLD